MHWLSDEAKNSFERYCSLRYRSNGLASSQGELLEAFHKAITDFSADIFSDDRVQVGCGLFYLRVLELARAGYDVYFLSRLLERHCSFKEYPSGFYSGCFWCLDSSSDHGDESSY